ncbi:MAG TPA: pyridoxamine 5'-phosphate oxidase family protein [Planctomycetota bacterium]|nr:pyridoxamine 5'-phosphate oxidase family protein [Planctomycetota bacterium]
MDKRLIDAPAEARETIRGIIERCVYGLLATVGVDGRSPKVRPVCAFLEDDFSILIPTHARTRKIQEIERNPRVELCFVDDRHWQVRFAGEVSIEHDTAVKKRLIETTLDRRLWRGFFPGEERDESFVLYRFIPESCEWMKEWELDYRRVV